MITNYQELQDAIRVWIDRNEISDYVQTFIQMFETDALLDDRIRETLRVSIDLEDGIDEYLLPADFGEVKSWSLAGSQYRVPLKAMSNTGDTLTDSTGDLGTPQGFLIMAGYFGANNDQAAARIYPAISGDYDSNLIYRATLAPLSNDNPTNWLLRRYPAIYLYGALAESAPYLRDDNRVPLWEAKKESLVSKLMSYDDMREFSGPTDVRYGLGGTEL